MDTRRSELADLMDRRRIELSRDWQEVADLAGITTGYLRTLRAGKGVLSPKTRTGLERGLEWIRGDIAQFMETGEPPRRAAPAAAGAPDIDAILGRLEALEEHAATLKADAAAAEAQAAEVRRDLEAYRRATGGTAATA